ncbi:HpcH/HpaI aldolase/citrate lyase family protein (plasmid) [Rhizobium leguminosarum]|uniref:CoA ester lyase n=1 Tax=Rhizobium leguminosarum TaxID=384 RepID=A0A6P0DDU8_RHILE|nr:CoA ester lyase [Rhizobium leguminosarum]ASS59790.1 CoA ester lyase [Rhizobium leguminosarum bv. viciae]AVC46038.1 hpcH/HpaI aldolase/citrate lyase family protein [Rhizobium leguminosarum bv. viciae]MBB4330958.1 citrate lyase subunit beta/citryl-CoA lyase [Rhizobium leguminosarum]MBB4340444.1 citrate lyase subunit beta/citryl-CoA lyase [Rhizobium leguminosarum]MBB4356145.1 citrate lyase subunit beta/citryl-CoA lyase [Rhizobium leguminosarum]
MRLRSLLFAPGDRPERFQKALASGADAVILDLEDSVAPLNKPKARESVHEFVLHHAGETALLIRINPLASPEFEDDLTALSGLHPFAIVLPKAEGATSVLKLAGSLASAIPILPIATETPSAIFEIGSYRDVSTSLCGLTWGAEDLPAAMGATTARRTDGRYTPPFEFARSLTLFGAHAAAVPAIDTVYPDFRDLNGLRAYVGRARRDGFSGMMAIHPSQVEVINHAFTPDASEIAWAEKVAAAFAARPDAGVIQLDGRMLDLPHLKLAIRILDVAGR